MSASYYQYTGEFRSSTIHMMGEFVNGIAGVYYVSLADITRLFATPIDVEKISKFYRPTEVIEYTWKSDNEGEWDLTMLSMGGLYKFLNEVTTSFNVDFVFAFQDWLDQFAANVAHGFQLPGEASVLPAALSPDQDFQSPVFGYYNIPRESSAQQMGSDHLSPGDIAEFSLENEADRIELEKWKLFFDLSNHSTFPDTTVPVDKHDQAIRQGFMYLTGVALDEPASENNKAELQGMDSLDQEKE